MNTDSKRITIRLSRGLYQSLQGYSAATGQNVADSARSVLERGLYREARAGTGEVLKAAVEVVSQRNELGEIQSLLADLCAIHRTSEERANQLQRDMNKVLGAFSILYEMVLAMPASSSRAVELICELRAIQQQQLSRLDRGSQNEISHASKKLFEEVREAARIASEQHKGARKAAASSASR